MPKPFKLETVLNHRQRLEEMAVQKLAEAINKEKILLSKLVEQEKFLNLQIEELTERQTTGISVHELQVYRLSIQRQQSQLQGLRNQAEQFAKEVENRRRQLAEACRKKKLLEKLKEKHLDEQTFLDNLKESAQLDEIALRTGMTDL
ncbi:MAG: flagellar export protein FliJ [Syntrophotaleaceae bacterium]